MKMLTLSIFPDWSPFSADISVCFVVDGGHIDIKFHYRGYDRPLLSGEKQTTGCTKPLVSILLSGHSYVSSFTLQTPAMTWHLVTKCHERTVSVTAWMMANRQLSFSEWWWGFMVYVSAVGSSADFYILWHFLAFGRWEEENQEAARMWHFHWFLMNEDREINNNCNLYNKDFVGSQSVSGVQSKSHKDTLRMTSSWWLRRMGDPACMCITQL